MSEQRFLDQAQSDADVSALSWLHNYAAGETAEAPATAETKPKKLSETQTRGFWSDFLGTTGADIATVLTRGVTLGILRPKDLPILGDILERNRTPDERKDALRKVAEFGGEMLAGSWVPGLGTLIGWAGRGVQAVSGVTGRVAGGVVRGAVEGTIIGAAQSASGAVRGEETPGSAALKVAGGAALGAAGGAVVGAIEKRLAGKAPPVSHETPPEIPKVEPARIVEAGEPPIAGEPAPPKVLNINRVTRGEAKAGVATDVYFNREPTLDEVRGSLGGMELPNTMIEQTEKGWRARLFTSTQGEANTLRAKLRPLVKPPEPPPGPPPGPPTQTREAARTVTIIDATEEQAKNFLKDHPDAIKVGDKALKIDWNEVGEPSQIDDVIKRVTKFMGVEGGIGKPAGGPVSDAETTRLLKLKGYNVEDLLSRRPMEGLGRVETRGAIAVMGAAADRLNQLRQLANQGDTEAKAETIRMLGVVGAVTKSAFGARAEAGASLREWGLMAEQARMPVYQRLDDLAKMMGTEEGRLTLAKGVKVDDLLAMLNQVMEVPKAQREGAVANWVHRTGKGLVQAWVQSLLTNPAVLAKKFFGDLSTLVLAVPERKAGQILHAIRRDPIPGVISGEASALAYGNYLGMLDMFRLALPAIEANRRVIAARGALGFGLGYATGTAFGTDQSTALEMGLGFGGAFALGGVGPLGRISGEVLDHSVRAAEPSLHEGGSWVVRAMDGLKSILAGPGNAIGTITDAMKIINFRGELQALAWRQSRGIEALTGEAADARIGELVAQPTEAMLDRAQRWAQERTFTDKLGPAATKFLHFLDSVDERLPLPLTKFLLPFRRVPFKLTAWTFEREPLAMLSAKYKADVAAGGVTADLAQAKVAVGSMLMAGFAGLAAAGYVTGNGPLDWKLKREKREQTGWQEDSIKVGDEYYSYRSLHPVGGMLGIVANASEMMAQIGSDDPLHEKIGEVAAAAALAVGKDIFDPTWMRMPAEILQAITSGERRTAENLKLGLARSVVPPGVAAARRVVDPAWLEVQNMLDAVRAQIPGLSKQVPPHVDLFGENIWYEGSLGPDIGSPVYKSGVKHDFVGEELARNNMRIPPVPRSLGGGQPETRMFHEPNPTEGIPLMPWERHRLAVLAGKEVEIGGKNLHDALSDLMASKDYENGSEGQGGLKELLVLRTVSAYRQEAQARLLEENEALRDAVEGARLRRVERLEAPAGSERVLSTLGR